MVVGVRAENLAVGATKSLAVGEGVVAIYEVLLAPLLTMGSSTVMVDELTEPVLLSGRVNPHRISASNTPLHSYNY